ncbi:MAG: M28 family peptidase [Leptospiraceae bacterium]|nr:M28 family peptidase [Leptospiraceae bacterium]
MKEINFFYLLTRIILGIILLFISCKNNINKTMSIEKPVDHKLLSAQLSKHIKKLASDIGERNPGLYKNLEKARFYIEEQLKNENLLHYNQGYSVNNHQFYNLVYEKKGESEKLPLIIIGAHYDSAPGTPGADDNATGVSALIEIAKKFSNITSTKHTIRFVFFTLEEPPFFKTEDMGSIRYSNFIKSKKEKVRFMLCLEMLGFFSEKTIQEYPLNLMRLYYPDKANFIGIVGSYGYSSITKRFYRIFQKENPLKSEVLIAPQFLTGVDFSDHASFWKNDYPAFMITDTAFYRNKNYHEVTDTPDTINYETLAIVTNSIFKTIAKMDQNEK